MALVKCPECGKEISDMAQSCPNCGRPLRMTNQRGVQNQGRPVQQQNTVQSKKPKKKGHGCLITLLIFVAIFVLIIIISVIVAVPASLDKSGNDTNSTVGAEQPKEEEVGSEIEFGQEGEIAEGLVLTVNEIAEMDSISVANGLLAYKPDSGKYAVINVTISNKSKESQNLLLNYFKLVGPDDAKYVATIIAVADDKFITVDTVNPNLDITGHLVFEIPKDLSAEECLLQYSDFNLFSKVSYFKLKK